MINKYYNNILLLAVIMMYGLFWMSGVAYGAEEVTTNSSERDWVELLVPPILTGVIVLLGGQFAIQGIKASVKKVEKQIVQIKEKIAYISGRMDELSRQKVGDSHSPIQLNRTGKGLLDATDGRKYIDDNFRTFYREFENIDNKYDVEKRAEDVLFDKRQDIENFVGNNCKNYMYENNLTTTHLIYAMVMVLRDKVFDTKDVFKKDKEE